MILLCFIKKYLVLWNIYSIMVMYFFNIYIYLLCIKLNKEIINKYKNKDIYFYIR